MARMPPPPKFGAWLPCENPWEDWEKVPPAANIGVIGIEHLPTPTDVGFSTTGSGQRMAGSVPPTTENCFIQYQADPLTTHTFASTTQSRISSQAWWLVEKTR